MRSTPPRHRRPGRTSSRGQLPPTPRTVRAMAAEGWTEAALRHAVAAGVAERLGWGVVAGPADLPDGVATRVEQEFAHLRSAQASSLRCDRATITHLAAAIAQGIPTFGPLARPCLTVPPGTALRELANAHLHRATLRPEDLLRVDDYEMTTPARTVMDIAREFGVDAGVVAADHVLNRGLTTYNELGAAFELCAGWPGRRMARITLSCADGDAESPLESVSRLRMAAAGLPAPELQVEICDLNGEYITRSDFYWKEFGVVGEADGRAKYDEEGRVATRQDETHTALQRSGLEVVRWGWSDLFPFDETVRQLQRAFRNGARPGSARRRWGVVLPKR